LAGKDRRSEKDDAATYAADTFSFIMTQPDSRFQRDLVDTGLVNGVTIGYYTQRNVGPIQILLQTTPDKAKAALKAVYTEISHFNDKDYYTDDQLESAKGCWKLTICTRAKNLTSTRRHSGSGVVDRR